MKLNVDGTWGNAREYSDPDFDEDLYLYIGSYINQTKRHYCPDYSVAKGRRLYAILRSISSIPIKNYWLPHASQLTGWIQEGFKHDEIIEMLDSDIKYIERYTDTFPMRIIGQLQLMNINTIRDLAELPIQSLNYIVEYGKLRYDDGIQLRGVYIVLHMSMIRCGFIDYDNYGEESYEERFVEHARDLYNSQKQRRRFSRYDT